ncbi:hypothetical protein PWT90_04506 [Aphanocladium album]|nr:hypothetical protein PWT90_04506 [Aphanocladium album]
MYKPAPARLKKTSITRTRTGCLGCRCDENKPTCNRCTRLGQECKWVTVLKFRHVHEAEASSSNSEQKWVMTDRRRGKKHGDDEDESHSSADSSTNDCVEMIGRSGQRRLFTPGALRVPHGLIPQADPGAAARFYSVAWDWQCLLPIASAIQCGDSHLLTSSPLFLDMMTAISASHLSRTSPQRRLLVSSSLPQQHNFRPDPAHESVSQEFYGSVMRKMARWSEHDFGANPILGLTVLTLFCLIESCMGSFQSFGLHFDGATKLIENFAAGALVQNRSARGLLEPLVEARMQMWWRRVYFGTLEFHRHRPEVALDPLIKSITVFETRRTLVLLILCESHRINNAAIIAHWDRYYAAEPENLHAPTEIADLQQKVGSFDQHITQEKEKLEAWCQKYPFSGVMQDTEVTSDNGALPLQVRPLQLESHAEAMNMAYYIASRVLQSSGPLQSLFLDEAEGMRMQYSEAETWIHFLLRVLAGMSWKDCVQYNMYTVGITGILLSCLLRSQDPGIGQWCETWLEGCLDGSSFEEGSFPAFQTLKIIRLVNEERRQGRDVFGLFQTVEDGGGSGKFGSYQSQALSSLLIYSRCRRTGQLFSYCMSI